MFKAVELPATVADLDPSLADVDGQALPHDDSKVQKKLFLGARLVQGGARCNNGCEAGARCAADPRLSASQLRDCRRRLRRSLKMATEPEKPGAAGSRLLFWDFSTLRTGGVGV